MKAAFTQSLLLVFCCQKLQRRAFPLTHSLLVFQAQPKESLLDISNSSMNSSAGTTDPWGMPLGGQQAPPKDPWGATLPAPQQVSSAWGSQASTPAARTTPTLAAAPPPYPQAAATDAWGVAVSSPAQATPSASTPGQ